MKTILFITLLSAVVLAQTPVPAPTAGAVRAIGAGIGPGTGPGLGGGVGPATVRFVAAANVGPTIAGAPYSAEAVNESIQTLADGNRIVESSSTKQYRDSAGRERRELGQLIVISDPVAKVRYNLHPETKTAEKMSAGASSDFFFVPFQNEGMKAARSAADAAVHTTYAFENRIEMGTSLITTTGLALNGVHAAVGAPIELLPLRTIEGVIANGTKSVRTIPAGEVGNERPIEVIDESWNSPELGVTVLMTHSDPRSGVTTYKLTNINRSEPPRSFFEVPADYTLVENPMVIMRKKEE